MFVHGPDGQWRNSLVLAELPPPPTGWAVLLPRSVRLVVVATSDGAHARGKIGDEQWTEIQDRRTREVLMLRVESGPW